MKIKSYLLVVLSALFVTVYSGQSLAKKSNPSHSKNTAQEQVVEQVDLNKASAEQLAKVLKGVGVKKAQAIVAFRDKIGQFKKVEQLLDVKGIGQATLDKNRSKIRL